MSCNYSKTQPNPVVLFLPFRQKEKGCCRWSDPFPVCSFCTWIICYCLHCHTCGESDTWYEKLTAAFHDIEKVPAHIWNFAECVTTYSCMNSPLPVTWECASISWSHSLIITSMERQSKDNISPYLAWLFTLHQSSNKTYNCNYSCDTEV